MDREFFQHNELRALHGSPAMELSEDLNTVAMEYAEHIASLGQMVHDPNLQSLGHGENIYWAWASGGTEINYGNAVEAWYNEITDPGYDFTNPGWQPGAGHFTQVIFKIYETIPLIFYQVVWKASTQLGMGHATANDGSVYVVARYY